MPTPGPAGPNGPRKQTQVDRLIEIATGESVELSHTPDGTAHAQILLSTGTARRGHSRGRVFAVGCGMVYLSDPGRGTPKRCRRR